ncbi:MAG: uracil-DNA glycosylase family protein, partial [Barnesiella intestinihominis]
IEQFLREKAIAVSDTVAVANRLNGNASDLTLEVVEPLNLAGILDQIPRCHTLVTTGQKATDTLLSITGSPAPEIGGFVDFLYHNRRLRLYRMPSTSRAYPKPLTDKAKIYRTIFQNFEQ